MRLLQYFCFILYILRDSGVQGAITVLFNANTDILIIQFISMIVWIFYCAPLWVAVSLSLFVVKIKCTLRSFRVLPSWALIPTNPMGWAVWLQQIGFLNLFLCFMNRPAFSACIPSISTVLAVVSLINRMISIRLLAMLTQSDGIFFLYRSFSIFTALSNPPCSPALFNFRHISCSCDWGYFSPRPSAIWVLLRPAHDLFGHF